MSQKQRSFAAQVKRARQELGYSQQRLAEVLGVSFATVNRWENERTMPSRLALRQFEQLCQDHKLAQEHARPTEDEPATPRRAR
jgi:transcriptional regulator with XRE-family HTH domain